MERPLHAAFSGPLNRVDRSRRIDRAQLGEQFGMLGRARRTAQDPARLGVRSERRGEGEQQLVGPVSTDEPLHGLPRPGRRLDAERIVELGAVQPRREAATEPDLVERFACLERTGHAAQSVDPLLAIELARIDDEPAESIPVLVSHGSAAGQAPFGSRARCARGRVFSPAENLVVHKTRRREPVTAGVPEKCLPSPP